MTIPADRAYERRSASDPERARRMRLTIVDRLRGLVIVLMALDHVREYFNREALLFVAEDLSRTTPLIFATRWITHLCAPTFVLLSGVSIALQQDAGKSGWRLSRFLLARGAWLILLEITVVSLLFDFGWPFLFLQVIWAIGASMVLLAGAVWLPRRAVLWLGVVIVVGGEVLAPLGDPTRLGSWWPWTLLMQPGVLAFVPSFVAYPAIPWCGIMAIGYGMGHVVLLPEVERDRRLVRFGIAMLGVFVAIRTINGYGNPIPWSAQSSAVFTSMSFMNVAKYPPSLDYTLATLGTTVALSPVLLRLRGPLANLLDAFGRTPLFTYLLHILLIHSLAMAVGVAMGFDASIFTNYIADPKRMAVAGWGLSIGMTYLVWAAVLLALWPASSWFADVKARRRNWWLSFI